MNQEVGDRGLHMEGRCLGNGAAADMDLDLHIIGIRHVADLLGLGNTTAEAHVRLDHAEGAVLEEGAVAQTGVDPLAGGHGDPDILLDLPHGDGVEGMDRLLVVHDVQVIDVVGQLDGSAGVREGVKLDDDVQIGAEVPDRLQSGANQLQHVLGELTPETPVSVLLRALPVAIGGNADTAV